MNCARFVLLSPTLALWLLWRTLRGGAVAAAALALICSTAFLPMHGYWEPWAHSHVWRTWRRHGQSLPSARLLTLRPS